MNLLYQSAFFEALGWSLIDSLWQIGAIWLMYILITSNGSKFSADKRHTLAFLGAVGGTLLFFLNVAINSYTSVADHRILSLAYFLEKQSVDFFPEYFKTEIIVPFLSFIYLPAFIFFSSRFILRLMLDNKVYSRSLMEAPSGLVDRLKEMSACYSIPRNVLLWISDKAGSPLTVGFWKPVIILPVAIFNHLTPLQVEAVIAHELHHVKRNDYLLNIIMTVCEVVLFFNPFAGLLFDIVRKERENRCDDHVIASGYDAWEYSHALYILGKQRYAPASLSVAATGIGKEYLLQRIRRIMKRTNPSPSLIKPFTAFFLCLLIGGFASRQTKTKPVHAVSSTPVASMVNPVEYYSEETNINYSSPVKQHSSKSKRSIKKTIVKSVIIIRETENRSMRELPVEAIAVEPSEEPMSSYVASPEVIEFTIIDPHKPKVPEQVICETPPPFVPESSFYYTEIDTTVGRKVIKL